MPVSDDAENAEELQGSDSEKSSPTASCEAGSPRRRRNAGMPRPGSRTSWTSVQLLQLVQEHCLWGHKWSLLARRLNKTDAQVKNIFHSAERSKSGCQKCPLLAHYARAVRDCAADPDARRAALEAARRAVTKEEQLRAVADAQHEDEILFPEAQRRASESGCYSVDAGGRGGGGGGEDGAMAAAAATGAARATVSWRAHSSCRPSATGSASAALGVAASAPATASAAAFGGGDGGTCTAAAAAATASDGAAAAASSVTCMDWEPAAGGTAMGSCLEAGGTWSAAPGSLQLSRVLPETAPPTRAAVMSERDDPLPADAGGGATAGGGVACSSEPAAVGASWPQRSCSATQAPAAAAPPPTAVMGALASAKSCSYDPHRDPLLLLRCDSLQRSPPHSAAAAVWPSGSSGGGGSGSAVPGASGPSSSWWPSAAVAAPPAVAAAAAAGMGFLVACRSDPFPVSGGVGVAPAPSWAAPAPPPPSPLNPHCHPHALPHANAQLAFGTSSASGATTPAVPAAAGAAATALPTGSRAVVSGIPPSSRFSSDAHRNANPANVIRHPAHDTDDELSPFVFAAAPPDGPTTSGGGNFAAADCFGGSGGFRLFPGTRSVRDSRYIEGVGRGGSVGISGRAGGGGCVAVRSISVGSGGFGAAGGGGISRANAVTAPSAPAAAAAEYGVLPPPLAAAAAAAAPILPTAGSGAVMAVAGCIPQQPQQPQQHLQQQHPHGHLKHMKQLQQRKPRWPPQWQQQGGDVMLQFDADFDDELIQQVLELGGIGEGEAELPAPTVPPSTQPAGWSGSGFSVRGGDTIRCLAANEDQAAGPAAIIYGAGSISCCGTGAATIFGRYSFGAGGASGTSSGFTGGDAAAAASALASGASTTCCITDFPAAASPMQRTLSCAYAASVAAEAPVVPVPLAAAPGYMVGGPLSGQQSSYPQTTPATAAAAVTSSFTAAATAAAFAGNSWQQRPQPLPAYGSFTAPVVHNAGGAGFAVETVDSTGHTSSPWWPAAAQQPLPTLPQLQPQLQHQRQLQPQRQLQAPQVQLLPQLQSQACWWPQQHYM